MDNTDYLLGRMEDRYMDLDDEELKATREMNGASKEANMSEEEKLIYDLQMKVATSSSLETKDYPNCIVMKKELQILLDLYNKEKEKNSKAREFIKENSHEFNCKRDDLIELEFDYNTNATDLIDILDGNW